MEEGFELVLVLVVVIGIVVTVARRIRAPWPVLLVITGLGLTLLPQFGHVEITPDLVLTVFLPPLLFGAAWYTPVQDFKRYRRAIVLLSVGLVLFTTFVVAYTADALIAGLPLAAAFALGAIVAPPDAISAIAVLRPLAVPRRMLAILEGESLVNDATALTAFSVSVAAVASGVFEPGHAVLDFLWVLAVGILVGVVTAVVSGWVWARLSDPPVEISLSLVVPYLAYLPAEQLHGSGVIAAVTAGLLLGHKQARILSSDARVLGGSVWDWVTYTLNGFAFLIIGLELPTVVDAVRGAPPRSCSCGPSRSASRSSARARGCWPPPTCHGSCPARAVGPAGAVTAPWWCQGGHAGRRLPRRSPGPAPGFPERDLLIFLAFCVILVTLVGQGPTLARRSSRPWASSPGTRSRARRRRRAGPPPARPSTRLDRLRGRVARPPAAHRPSSPRSSSIGWSTCRRTARHRRPSRSGSTIGRSWRACSPPAAVARRDARARPIDDGVLRDGARAGPRGVAPVGGTCGPSAATIERHGPTRR
ncbi:MAG: cation:proton antiporter [Chloroflexota bacterium]